MHDIGNSINRHDHAHSGAALAYQILKGMRMPLEDILVIVTAIGHHDESTGTAVDVVSAALILADKTDVRRNRVQNPNIASFDAHDRVNYAALSTSLEIKEEKKVIQVELELDDTMCTVMDYFEIFLQRMLMCKRAAEVLGLPVQAAWPTEASSAEERRIRKVSGSEKNFCFAFSRIFGILNISKDGSLRWPEKGERRMLCRTEKF